MKVTCYIPCGGDLQLTERAIKSFWDEIGRTEHEAKLVVINNTETPIGEMRADVINMPVRLLHGQSINWMIRQTRRAKDAFCMSLHNDAMLYPGALQEILDKWDEVQYNDPRWGTITLGHNNGDAFVLWNPEFFFTENVWHNPVLLPFYFLDNHLYRLMELRGWTIYHTENDLVLHEGSHTIKNDPVARRVNDIVFPHHGAIYKDIWGGMPGEETSRDPYARGTLSRN